MSSNVTVIRKKELISRSPGFAGLPSGLLEDLAARLGEETFPAGAVVAREGDVADRMYIIDAGRAEVSTAGAAGAVLLTTLGAGDMFGEIGLLTEARRRRASVRAAETLRVVSLAARDFEEVLKAHPEVRIDLVMGAESQLSAKYVKTRQA